MAESDPDPQGQAQADDFQRDPRPAVPSRSDAALGSEAEHAGRRPARGGSSPPRRHPGRATEASVMATEPKADAWADQCDESKPTRPAERCPETDRDQHLERGLEPECDWSDTTRHQERNLVPSAIGPVAAGGGHQKSGDSHPCQCRRNDPLPYGLFDGNGMRHHEGVLRIDVVSDLDIRRLYGEFRSRQCRRIAGRRGSSLRIGQAESRSWRLLPHHEADGVDVHRT